MSTPALFCLGSLPQPRRQAGGRHRTRTCRNTPHHKILPTLARCDNQVSLGRDKVGVILRKRCHVRLGKPAPLLELFSSGWLTGEQLSARMQFLARDSSLIQHSLASACGEIVGVAYATCLLNNRPYPPPSSLGGQDLGSVSLCSVGLDWLQCFADCRGGRAVRRRAECEHRLFLLTVEIFLKNGGIVRPLLHSNRN